MKGINKWQYDFMIDLFGLFLSIKGRLNFLQLGRYGSRGEQHYRNQFSKSFDFLSFNKELISEHAGEHLTIAFDPSYVSKSGKVTSGVGYYWSGVAGKAKWGLEISGIAAIDIENHTAFHLEAVQTPNDLQSESLLEHYAHILVQRKSSLLSISKYVVADAYFSKHGFVSKLSDNGFETVSRLRDDADLRYIYKGKPKTGKGRPKKYDGKINYNNLKEEHFTAVEVSDKNKIYQATVFSKSLKREINLVIVYTNKKGKWKHKLYFCTDLNLSAEMLLYKIYFYITQIICIFPQKKMGRSTRKISGYSSSEIKALFKTEDKYKIRIRLYAVYQISLGKPSRELEVLYNTSFKQILNWASRFEKEGIEGLRDKKGRGRKSKLTDAQKEQLKEVVLKKSPENYGYNTSTWNGPLLIDWLNKHMGVFYQRAQIYNVLKSLGLTYQKSKGFYPEADKEKQSIFKETLKKNFLNLL